MHLDTFFTMGKSHKVCEDYALCSQEKSFFSISDGCSSSKDTDFGSRILLKSLENSFCDNVFDWTKIYDKANLTIRALQMPSTCLDATLNFGFLKEIPELAPNLRKGFEVWCIGDGFIVATTNGGGFEVTEIEFDKNAPYYLSYVFDHHRKNEFMKLNQKKTITVTDYDADCRQCNYSYTRDDEGTKDGTIAQVDQFSKFWFSEEVYSSVSVFSDGLKTFIPHDQTQPKMPLEKVIKELISFPVLTGSFVQRRCLKFMKTHSEASFYDDFSMATWVRG